MKTKYGNAKINSNGYYQITSTKEGNYGKYLHRLIWEDFYRCKVQDGYVIHHEDFNKLNNHITNLSCMSKEDHTYLHNCGENNYNYGKHLSEETKEKMSEAHKGIPQSEEHKINRSKSTNTTGYLNVYKQKDKRLKQGFRWKYQYTEDGKTKSISSVDIEKLKKKVKARGLKWYKFERND